MSQNSESSCQKRQTILEVDSLPFARIPHQSKLFLDFQRNAADLKRFYPNAVESFPDVAKQAENVLANYKTDRSKLCDALESDNKSYAAGSKTLENIKLLRESDCVAVVTGQQAGLFSGAVYTVYKALSAVKAAECLRGRGIKAVPVFWIAEEDHDFDEVKKTFVIDGKGGLKKIENTPHNYQENTPVGAVKLDETIDETIAQTFETLTQTEFSEDLHKLLNETYNAAENYSTSFAKFLIKLFANYGLIILSPLNAELKNLAAPIFVETVNKSDEIREKLLMRSVELERNGYHSQVLVESDFFPFFWLDEDGKRLALKKTKTGNYQAKNTRREFNLTELSEIAEHSPQNLSPNALTRPVVQDYLLPTICYFGGAAEIAYFAQNSVIYETLNRPAATILHRQSFTVIEAKHRRTLEKYDLKLENLFGGFESFLPNIAEKYLNPQIAANFDETEKLFDSQLAELERNLRSFDPTLADNLIVRRRKILYHIGALRKKYHRAALLKDETIHRQITAAFAELLPHNALQERTINIASFLNRHGNYFINWIYDAIDLEDKAHRVIYL